MEANSKKCLKRSTFVDEIYRTVPQCTQLVLQNVRTRMCLYIERESSACLLGAERPLFALSVAFVCGSPLRTLLHVFKPAKAKEDIKLVEVRGQRLLSRPSRVWAPMQMYGSRYFPRQGTAAPCMSTVRLRFSHARFGRYARRTCSSSGSPSCSWPRWRSRLWILLFIWRNPPDFETNFVLSAKERLFLLFFWCWHWKPTQW